MKPQHTLVLVVTAMLAHPLTGGATVKVVTTVQDYAAIARDIGRDRVEVEEHLRVEPASLARQERQRDRPQRHHHARHDEPAACHLAAPPLPELPDIVIVGRQHIHVADADGGVVEPLLRLATEPHHRRLSW